MSMVIVLAMMGIVVMVLRILKGRLLLADLFTAHVKGCFGAENSSFRK